jgi:hypothetical protein
MLSVSCSEAELLEDRQGRLPSSYAQVSDAPTRQTHVRVLYGLTQSCSQSVFCTMGTCTVLLPSDMLAVAQDDR